MRLQTLSLPCSCCLTPPICSAVLTGIGELGEISTSSPHSFLVYFTVIGGFLQIQIIVPIRFSVFFYLIGGFFLFTIFSQNCSIVKHIQSAVHDNHASRVCLAGSRPIEIKKKARMQINLHRTFPFISARLIAYALITQ